MLCQPVKALLKSRRFHDVKAYQKWDCFTASQNLSGSPEDSSGNALVKPSCSSRVTWGKWSYTMSLVIFMPLYLVLMCSQHEVTKTIVL